MSKQSFSSMAQAIKYAERTYRRDDRARRTFLDSLTFYTVSKEGPQSARGGWTKPEAAITRRGKLRPLVLGEADDVRDRIVNRPRKRGVNRTGRSK